MVNVRAWSKNLLLVLASTLLALGICEACLQVFYDKSPAISGWRSPKNLPLEPNQLGFRGQQIDYTPDEFVVVLLGDSHVESLSLEFPDMPEKRLQRHLRALGIPASVVTLGSGGYGQDQQLLVLEEYFRNYRADAVVLWQSPENDVWNNMFPTHWPVNGRRKPTYHLDGDKLVGPNERMGLNTSRIKLIALVEQFFEVKDKDGYWERYLPDPYVPMLTYAGPVSHEWQQRWDSDTGFMRLENLATEKTHFILKLTPRSKRTEYGIRLTHRLLEEINRVAQSNGADFFIFEPARPWWESEQDQLVYLLNNRYYSISRSQFQENIRDINKGFRVLAVPVTVKNWRVSASDGHFNARATNQIMHDLAGLLLQQPGE